MRGLREEIETEKAALRKDCERTAELVQKEIEKKYRERLAEVKKAVGDARERNGKRYAALEGEAAQLSMQYQWEAEQLRGALREETEKGGKLRAVATALERSNNSMKSEGKQHLATLE